MEINKLNCKFFKPLPWTTKVTFNGKDDKKKVSKKSGHGNPSAPLINNPSARAQPSAAHYRAQYSPYLGSESEERMIITPNNYFNFIKFNDDEIRKLIKSGERAKRDYRSNAQFRENIFQQLLDLTRVNRGKNQTSYSKGEIHQSEVDFFITYVSLLAYLMSYRGNPNLQKSLQEVPAIITDAAVYFFCNQNRFDATDIDSQAKLANAFSKINNKKCERATAKIASFLTPDQVKKLNVINIAKFTNVFSKFPYNNDCQKAIIMLAKQVSALAANSDPRHNLFGFIPQGIANLVNGFSKFPQQNECQEAIDLLAKHVSCLADVPDPQHNLFGFTSQGIANLVNGFSKFSQNSRCQSAIIILAKHMKDLANLQDPQKNLFSFNSQEFANLVNGFSKLVEDQDCQTVIIRLARHIPVLAADQDRKKRLTNFIPQGITNLVNGFSKLVENQDCQIAIPILARHVSCLAANKDSRKNLNSFNSQDFANLVNGFSKLVEDPACQAVIPIMARHVSPLIANNKFQKVTDNSLMQHLANLVNGFSKLVENQDCQTAIWTVAKYINGNKQKTLEEFTFQPTANLVNGFSKYLEKADCGKAVCFLAEQVINLFSASNKEELLKEIKHQEVTNLVNGFSKFPEKNICQTAVFLLAEHVASIFNNSVPEQNPIKFSGQDLGSLVNGFSKFPETSSCQIAVSLLAEHVASLLNNPVPEQNPIKFNGQDLGNLVNGFSKFPESVSCRTAIFCLAKKVNEIVGNHDPEKNLITLNIQDMVHLVNGFSKCLENADCQTAVSLIAKQIVVLAKNPDPKKNLASFNSHQLANLVNGFSKLPDIVSCQTVISLMAKHVSCLAADPASQNIISSYGSQAISNLANGFNKFPDDRHCKAACAAMAREVLAAEDLNKRFEMVSFPMLLNAFGKWDEDLFIDASAKITYHLNTQTNWLDQAGFKNMAMVVNSLSRLEKRMSEEQKNEVNVLLKQIAIHLLTNQAKVQKSSLISLGMLLKGFFKLGLQEDEAVKQLSFSCLAQIQELTRSDQLKQENLETVGNLCIALLPFFHSFQLREQRGEALDLLVNKLNPIVQQKLKAYHQAQTSSNPQQVAVANACQTRNPALSIYQILKTYAGVVEHWTSANVRGERKRRLKAKRQELENWLKQVYRDSEALITNDLSKYSWDLIAELEAENPTKILDEFIIKHQAEIIAQNSPTFFDYHQVFAELNKEPDLPPAGKGLTTVSDYNLKGKQLGTGNKRYSILGRLTGEKLPVAMIALPGHLSKYMLGRTVKINQTPYRFDLFGGNQMKAKRKSLKDLTHESASPGKIEETEQKDQPFPTEAQAPYGKLVALPLAETTPRSSFASLIKDLFPNEESFFYFPRMLMSSILEIPGVEHPAGHVLEGRFQLGWLPDRPANQAHSFQIKDKNGYPIELRPHDGCGFIKESLAQKMPAYQLGKNQSQYGSFLSANLPPQALQHYPPNQEVAQETVSQMQQQLQGRSEAPRGEELFRYVTTGGIKGDMGVAVPAADNKVHLPQIKSTIFAQNPAAGLLVGKSPYDKPNLRPIEPDRVGLSAQGDRVAQFLEEASVLQYSFVGQEQRKVTPKEKPLFFAKGLLVVIPDEQWPADFINQNIVMSAEDIKTHSQWLENKERVTKDTLLTANGMLVLTNFFPPGSCAAVPITEQKKVDGDYDGDPMLLVAGRPQLYQHVRQQDQQTVSKPSLKPPKTHTKAIGLDQSYQFGRAQQIMSTRFGVLESFATLQNVFLAQPEELKNQLADQIIFTVFESLPPNTKKILKESLDDAEQPKLQAVLNDLKKQYLSGQHPATQAALYLLATGVRDFAREQNLVLQFPQDFQMNEAGRTSLFTFLGPQFNKDMVASQTAEERLETLLHYLPQRILEKSTPGYIASQPVQTVRNLLSLGIKIGTDAYKSNTGIHKYNILAERLKKIVQKDFGLPLIVPYGKNLAKKLNKGELDIEETLATLAKNPTLEGQLMSCCLKKLQSQLNQVPPQKSPAAVASKAKSGLNRPGIAELYAKGGLTLPKADQVSLPEVLNLARTFIQAPNRFRLNSPNRADLVNLFSKFLEQDVCQVGMAKLAQQLAQETDLRAYNPRQLSILGNSFGMLEQPDCQEACQKIAQTIMTRDLRQFNLLYLANLANSFSKWSSPAFVRAGYQIASHLKQEGARLQEGSLVEKSLLIHAFSQITSELPSTQRIEVHTLVQQLAQRLVTNPTQLRKEGLTLSIALLLKGLFRMGLKKEGYQLAESCLTRLESLTQENQLHEVDVETLGNLCMGLISLTAADAPAKEHQRAASLLAEKLQPIIAQKLNRYLAAETRKNPSSSLDEAFGTRIPVVSIYQILKTYIKIQEEESSVTFRNLQFIALKKWLKEFEAKAEPLIISTRRKANQRKLLAEIDRFVSELQ